MALVTSKEMFQKAYEGKYAVGAFNVNNMEIVQGIVDAAKVENAPLILQVSAGARKYAKHIYLMKLVEAAMEDSGIDICLHLEAGTNLPSPSLRSACSAVSMASTSSGYSPYSAFARRSASY